MSYDLQIARSAAAASGDAKLTALVDTAVDEVRAAFGELRDLAHGIYPAVLDAAGLGAAIAALSGTTNVSIDVDGALAGRLPPVIETTAYLVVATIVEASKPWPAATVDVSVARKEGALTIDIRCDLADLDVDLQHLDDRVGAAGGLLVVTPNRITAELPCESLSPTT